MAADPRERRVAPVSGRADWERCTHHDTAVDPATGEVRLAPLTPADMTPWPAPPGGAVEPAGPAFDAAGCLYRGVPERGQIQRLTRGAPPVDLLAGPLPRATATEAGFVGRGGDPRRPLRAVALAADRDDHLFVLDGGRVAVLDLADGHLLRTVALPAPAVDLAGDGPVLVATADRARPLLRLDALGAPVAVPVGPLAGVPARARPSRVAVGPDGAIWLLLRDGGDAWVVAADTGRPAWAVPGGTDLEIDGTGRVVVAGPPGTDLATWVVTGPVPVADVPLRARGHDGRGLVRTPEGRIGFVAGDALRVAGPRRLRFGTLGTTDTTVLDGLRYGLRWGRVFVEACVPAGTRLLVAAETGDDVPTGPVVPSGPPGPLHRRESGRESPWAPAPGRFAVYEAPIAAPPGRYLRLRLQLVGPGSVTPLVRAVRAEFPAHDLLDALPRTYRRDPAGAAFLHRYLAIVDGELGDMEGRAVHRDLLLDPWGAPSELLAWLGSLVGIALDARWPEQARRTLLSEAGVLFRRRGTVGGLTRLLEICLGTPVTILEAFRLRGSGRAFVGGVGGDVTAGAAVVGGTLQVGGAGGDGTASPYAAHAHRFTVVVPRELSADETAVVRDLLEAHRPAHTVVDICPVGNGMRVGQALYLGVSTIMGPGSGFRPVRVGDALGPDGVLGRGRAGVRPGATALGRATVVDA